jgi:hypothetical protein
MRLRHWKICTATAVVASTITIGVMVPAWAASRATRVRQIPVEVLRGPTQYGINVRWSYFNEPPAQLANQLKTTINYIKSLGANSVALAFDIYVSSPTSNTVIAGPGTPSATQVGQFVAVARHSGLFVLLRPLITETNLSEPWRGEIQPANRPLWFQSYESFLGPYLVAAQVNGAQEFAYSCELSTLEGDLLWKTSFLPFAKKYFRRALMFDVSWDTPGLSPMANRTYGIDMYPAVQLPASATVKQLVSGWNAWLSRFPVKAQLSRSYMVEIGIAAQADAYTHPSLSNWHTPYIPSVQSKWFQAACTFFRQHKMRGIYFFSTSLNAGPQLNQTGQTPQDFQGLSPSVIRTCFRG